MISWRSYFERVVNLKTQFDLAGTAIDGWGHSQEALDRYATEELEDLRSIFRRAAEEKGEDAEAMWVFADSQRVNEYLDHVRTTVPQRLPDVKARLVQNEYLLHVAIFESFMKSIHREILRATPKLLQPNRAVELGKLISQGQDAILGAEIEREVQALDRQTTQKKAEYFRDRLGIDWFGGTAVPLLDGVIKLRNVILHEDPDRLVGEAEHALLALITTAVSFATVAGAAVLYPAACSLPEGMREDDARIFTTAYRGPVAGGPGKPASAQPGTAS